MLARWPTGRRIAFTTLLCLAVALTIAVALQGMSNRGWLRALEVLAIVASCAAVAALVIGLIVSKLANYQDPEDEAEFERLVVRSEELARENLAAEPDEDEFLELDPFNPIDFDQLVREALDDLPDLLIKALDRVPVVVSDKGRQRRRLRALPGRHRRPRQLPRPHHHLPRHAAARLRARPRPAARSGHADGSTRAGAPPGCG